MTHDRSSHGWWPYVLPYLGFLMAVEIGRRLPEAAQPWMLLAKPLIPLGLILWFGWSGEYPELRAIRLRWTEALQDVAVGLALAVLWAAPYLLIPSLRPDPAAAFDPQQLGTEWVPLALGLRLFGYALVTPLFEELFIRSFVMRYAEVYGRRGDFRDVPIAHFSARSFVVTIVVFTVGHVPWEWWVAVPWVALTNLWFYRRRNLASLMIVHGVTNAALLGLAIWGGGLFLGEAGEALSLWFFV
jgi:uncharacterized protein